MSDETYNGWSNRESWALSLWIDNDAGWQERVAEAISDAVCDLEGIDARTQTAGETLKDSVDEALMGDDLDNYKWQRDVLHDVGSLWRINWEEIGTYYLSGLDES